jgi:hypothetical protein
MFHAVFGFTKCFHPLLGKNSVVDRSDFIKYDARDENSEIVWGQSSERIKMAGVLMVIE